VAPDLRIYLTPKIWLERGGSAVDDRVLPGRQGRVAFAYLVLERRHPVTKDQLAEALWPDELPTSWGSSLSAIASKIRTFLGKVGLQGSDTLTSALGCYQLHLPPESWVDIEAAQDAQHAAETFLRAGNFREAYGPNDVSYKIARRPFLPGAEGEWVERFRRKLRDTFLRAAELRSEIYFINGEPDMAVQMAEEALAVEPFRESAYRQLIRAHLGAGSRAEAVRAYERCRVLLQRELGVDPSPETEALVDEVRGRRPAPTPVADRVFATVLFTDIVSSTPRTAELGDRRWRELLDRHDDVIRAELEQCGGRLVKATGDGVLATFDGPARAVRCARAIGDAVHALGLEMRAGLHAGEVEVRGDDLTGIAVNIARRVCDTGSAGEVLVSRTVVDLVAGSEIGFQERGAHELKGVPGTWELYAVR
jgi:class 3 adenylate cyclase